MATGQQIIDHFQFLTDDDNISSDRELILANLAYQRINSMRSWNYLRKEDTTNTLAAATTTYSLPSDFMYLTDEDAIKAVDSTNNGYTQLRIVPFRERREFQGHENVVYIDVANSNIVFPVTTLNGLAGKTLNITYQYLPDDLAVGTSPVFKSPFHLVISYDMAKNFWYNDQVEKDRAWNREMQSDFNTLLREMTFWDDNLEHAIAPTWRPKSWVSLEDGGMGGSNFPNSPFNF